MLRNLQSLFDHGRLGGTGYVSILPVDQGIEHSAAASFAPEPEVLRPGEHRRARHRGRLQRGRHAPSACSASVSRKYAHQHPVHREAQPQRAADRTRTSSTRSCSASVEQAYDLGAAGVGATIYFGSDEATRQIQEVSEAFAAGPRARHVHRAVVLPAQHATSRSDGIDYHVAADLTGQANHLGVTIEADIIKQKLPENNGGYNALEGYGKTSKLVYDELTTDHPIDLTRWQVANCYMGRIGLINSGGASTGASDLAEAVRTAVINKRAGGTGLISGRKAFQRPMAEGIELLNAIQDVYLDASITVA